MIWRNRHDHLEVCYRVSHNGADFTIKLENRPAGSDMDRHHRWYWFAEKLDVWPPPIPVEGGWCRWRWQARRQVTAWVKANA